MSFDFSLIIESIPKMLAGLGLTLNLMLVSAILNFVPVSGHWGALPNTAAGIRRYDLENGSIGSITKLSGISTEVHDDRLSAIFKITCRPMDGTERPVQRPQKPSWRKATYSGKKKRHTAKHPLPGRRLQQSTRGDHHGQCQTYSGGWPGPKRA